MQTVLHLSRDPGSIIHLGIITLPNSKEWVIASREKENDEATMHLFQLKKTSPTELVESSFKRYFRLYKDCNASEGIFAGRGQFIGPEYYLIREKLFCLGLEGEFC